MSKPMFSNDDERRPLLTEEELRHACFHDAATIVVAIELGCEFEDCRVDDDGRPWPTAMTRIEIKYPGRWGEPGAEVFPAIATIHEAGCRAVAKRHGRGPHRIDNYTAVRTSDLLDEPRMWKAIEALARFIENNYEGDGCYGALGTGYHEPGETPTRLSCSKPQVSITAGATKRGAANERRATRASLGRGQTRRHG